MDVDPASDEFWQSADLHVVLLHQLRAPVLFDLREQAREAGSALEPLTQSRPRQIVSFADLFDDADPPLELLDLTKRFAKDSLRQAPATLPKEIATLIYYVALALAMSRCGQRISELDDRTLEGGFRWGLAQAWITPELRRILSEGLDTLGAAAQSK